MDNPPLVVSVALRLACRWLARQTSRSPADIQYQFRVQVLEADEPMTSERVNLMVLRFACEALSDETLVPAYIIEDNLLQQARNLTKGF